MVRESIKEFNTELEEVGINRYLDLHLVDNGAFRAVELPNVVLWSEVECSNEFAYRNVLGNIVANYTVVLSIARKELKKELSKFFKELDDKFKLAGYDIPKLSFELHRSGAVFMQAPSDESVYKFMDDLDITGEFRYAFGDLRLIIQW